MINIFTTFLPFCTKCKWEIEKKNSASYCRVIHCWRSNWVWKCFTAIQHTLSYKLNRWELALLNIFITACYCVRVNTDISSKSNRRTQYTQMRLSQNIQYRKTGRGGMTNTIKLTRVDSKHIFSRVDKIRNKFELHFEIHLIESLAISN